jgi:hypothetical protein
MKPKKKSAVLLIVLNLALSLLTSGLSQSGFAQGDPVSGCPNAEQQHLDDAKECADQAARCMEDGRPDSECQDESASCENEKYETFKSACDAEAAAQE